MSRRIVIIGGPHVGKTTLAKRLRDECGISNTHHSDDVKHLGWSESSAAVSEWFNESGEWIVEGVQAARALRKWLKANPDAELDADILILDHVFGDLLPVKSPCARVSTRSSERLNERLCAEGLGYTGLTTLTTQSTYSAKVKPTLKNQETAGDRSQPC
jgi:adenylate kinase family enzyme